MKRPLLYYCAKAWMWIAGLSITAGWLTWAVNDIGWQGLFALLALIAVIVSFPVAANYIERHR